MKSQESEDEIGTYTSPPSRGAWIEILLAQLKLVVTASPPSRGAWIEIPDPFLPKTKISLSPPSRGAWIEMPAFLFSVNLPRVAPLAGGVD